MDAAVTDRSRSTGPAPIAALLARIEAAIPAMQARAAELDRQARFAAADLAMLRECGCLRAPIPSALGGSGMGTEPEGAAALARLLGALGRGNPAVGRVFEAHVNALRLIARYGTADQLGRAAADAADGELFALWVTGDDDGLVLRDGRLHGEKPFCSAAGWATRPLVTARCEPAEAPVLVLAELPPGHGATPLDPPPQGMRAAGTGRMRFDGVAVRPDAVIGAPGDYLRQPEFSGGAWRGSAVISGAIAALVAQAASQLGARGRAADPHQAARLGEALIAQETAALWIARAAEIVEDPRRDVEDRAQYANLARIAVEQAAARAIALVQRSLGLAAFMPPNPAERMLRDLATYMRQPAADETLTEAAAWFGANPLPASGKRPG